MIDDTRLERVLPEILENLGRAPAPDYAGRILVETARIRQRPAWVFPEGWLPARLAPAGARSASLSWRPVVVLALLVLALAAAVALAVGASRPRVPPPFGPAANGEILYGAGGDIFSVDPVTGISRRLATTEYADSSPQYSPDGRHVVFMREPKDIYSPHTTDLVIMNADGSHDRILNSTPLSDYPAWLEWAPDSRTILVVTSDRADAVMETFDTSRTGPATVIDTPGIQPQQVVFQPPDGRRILVRGKQGFGDGLWTMNADGTDVLTVVAPYETWASDDLQGAMWSPDGTRVLYQREPDADPGQRLFVANADGSDAHEVAGAAGGLAHQWGQWSPDSTRIVFARLLVAETVAKPRRYQYAVVSLADGHVVYTGPVFDGWSSVAWSPDSTQLVVVRSTGQPVPALLLDPDGGPAVEAGWSADQGGGWQRIAP